MAGEHRNFKLRLMSYNIQHGMGMDGKVDLDRTAAVIGSSGADIVFLQEVDRCAARSGRMDQIMALAELSGLKHACFGRAIDLEGGEYGNGILSRYPLERTALLPLPGREPRSALACMARLPDGAGGSAELQLISVHLDDVSEADRLASVEVLRRSCALWDARPAVLAGDFNAAPDSPAVRELLQDWHAAPGGLALPTWPSEQPEVQLDYLLVNGHEGWGLAEGGTDVWIERMASDHLPLRMEVELVLAR